MNAADMAVPGSRFWRAQGCKMHLMASRHSGSKE